MKINRICLNCKKNRLSGIVTENDFTFFLFRTPVTFRIDGEKIKFNNNSAVIFSRGCNPDFMTAEKHSIVFDYIGFNISALDKQYILSINVPVNIPVTVYDDFAITNTLKSMKSEFSIESIHHEELMELYMKIIFLSLCEISVKENMPDILHYDKLKALRNAIITEPMKLWDIEEICYHLNMSRTYFHRLYRQAFGTTCIQDVIQNRISYACNLLKNTDLSVSEISEKCGYENYSYFMRQFRKHKNCTPSEFRHKSRH